MILAITGPRAGCTDAQLLTLGLVLSWLRPVVELFVHGDCVGVDVLGHRIARTYNYDIVCRPCTAKSRAFTDARPFDIPRPPLQRNKLIAGMCTAIIGVPDGPERDRSGTWHCLRAARRYGRPLLLIWPDGSVEVQ